MSIEAGPVIFPEHFGFCEGVKSADGLLRDVTLAARDFGISEIYGYHGIVHNDDVIRSHQANGVKFVDEIDQIPDNSVVVTSAHGVGPETVFALEKKGATVFDATCPLVAHTHREVETARKNKEKVIYICHGKPGVVDKLHDEVAGIVGRMDYTVRGLLLFNDPLERTYRELNEAPDTDILSDKTSRYRIITQTTLDAERCLILRKEIMHFIMDNQPNAKVGISSVGDVCLAVTNRQKGVGELVRLNPDRLVIATDRKSKNGMGYVALAKSLVADKGLSIKVYDVASAEEAIELGEITGTTAITASASTPDEITFAIASSLGLKDLPDVDRKAFKLHDADMGHIRSKLIKHVNRVWGI